MGKQVNFPVHEKYLKLSKPVTTEITRFNDIKTRLVIKRVFTDGTFLRVELILPNNTSLVEAIKNSILAKNGYAVSLPGEDYPADLFMQEGATNVNPRDDFNISDPKELFNWYNEHIRIIGNQILFVSQQIADTGTGENPLSSILIGTGGAITAASPLAGLVVTGVGLLLSLFKDDNSAYLVEKKQLLESLTEQYKFYYPYLKDAKDVLIDIERGKIIDNKNGGKGGKGGNGNEELNPKGNDNTLIIILLIVLFLFRKKIF